MIKQRRKDHRRNQSELFYTSNHLSQKLVSKKQKDRPQKNKSKGKSKQVNIVNLINKSGKMVDKRMVIVENIQNIDNNTEEEYFCFGKGAPKQHPITLNMEQIEEVPDTTSPSQRIRQDELFSENQKIKIMRIANRQASQIERTFNQTGQQCINSTRPTRKSEARIPLKSTSTGQLKVKIKNRKIQPKDSIKLKNQRAYSSSKQSKSQSLKEDIKIIKMKTNKLQKSIKMIWECMGDLWQNTRACKYKIEQNEDSILELKRVKLKNTQVFGKNAGQCLNLRA